MLLKTNRARFASTPQKLCRDASTLTPHDAFEFPQFYLFVCTRRRKTLRATLACSLTESHGLRLISSIRRAVQEIKLYGVRCRKSSWFASEFFIGPYKFELACWDVAVLNVRSTVLKNIFKKYLCIFVNEWNIIFCPFFCGKKKKKKRRRAASKAFRCFIAKLKKKLLHS